MSGHYDYQLERWVKDRDESNRYDDDPDGFEPTVESKPAASPIGYATESGVPSIGKVIGVVLWLLAGCPKG